jgi:addiction module HigA family antidote
MKNPPHPGLSVRADCLEPLGLTVTQAAKALGVSRQALNNLIHGQARISPEMAIRLDKAFGGGAETWLRLQATYDLAQLGKEADKIKVKRMAWVGELPTFQANVYAILPSEAQYVVPFAYKIRWYMKMNLREALHMVELCTMPQGHPDYRCICQEMWRKIQEVHPTLADAGKFIDWQKYRLGRLQSEMRTEFKKSAMEKGK